MYRLDQGIDRQMIFHDQRHFLNQVGRILFGQFQSPHPFPQERQQEIHELRPGVRVGVSADSLEQTHGRRIHVGEFVLNLTARRVMIR